MSFQFEGNVVDADSGQPLAGAKVYLAAGQQQLNGVGGAIPTGKGYSWTRLINGSEVGTPKYRYAAYEKLIQPNIPAGVLDFPTFRDRVLDWNAHLEADGRLFLPGHLYVIPTLDNGPEMVIETISNEAGFFSFSGLERSGVYGFQAEKAGYKTALQTNPVFDSMISLPDATIPMPLTLSKLPAPQPATQQRIYSTDANRASLPTAVQKFVQLALLLVTDNEAKACAFLNQLNPRLPFQPYGPTKQVPDTDVVCADLPSLCYAYALGRTPNWVATRPEDGIRCNPHMATMYLPQPGNSGSLQSVNGPVMDNSLLNDTWKLGDLIIYGQTLGGRASHVNVYVGPFEGIDLDGKPQQRANRPSVINTSINDQGGDPRINHGVLAFDLAGAAKPGFAGKWVQHVRLLDLWR